MKLKIYIFFSLLLVGAIGGFVHFYITQAVYKVELYGFALELPISAWFALSAGVVFLASLGHIMFYGFLSFLKRSALEKDLKSVNKVFLAALGGRKSEISFSSKELRPVEKLLKSSKVVPLNPSIKTDDPDIDRLLFQIEKQSGGEIADFANFQLPDTSHLIIQNKFLELKKDPKLAEEILKKGSEDARLIEVAFEKFIEFADKKAIAKYSEKLNKQTIKKLLARYKKESNPLALTLDEIKAYCKQAAFTQNDFVEVISILKANIQPEEILEIAFELKKDFVEASYAWIYINLELEKLDDVNDILESSSDEDYLEFRKYITLKNAGLKTSLDEFFTCK